MRDASSEAEIGIAFTQWLTAYKQAHRDLLGSDPEFKRWLEEEYRPIAGGWMY